MGPGPGQPPPPGYLQPPPSMAPPPPPPPPARRRFGDIPINTVYLFGAILGTVLAVLLVFVVFSGDVPTRQDASEEVISVAPVPSVSATATPTTSPTPTETPIVLPPVPAGKAYKTLPGTASAVTSTITDKTVGITYPRLASPWKARSFSPFSIAQRIGKVEIPHTVIGSAMYPGDSPAKKPTSNADYREIATEAARWTIRTQYPKGATLDEWTGSKKIPVGKGWTLGYKVSYTLDGKKQEAQAMVTIVELGKNKPGMLMASIPEANKKHWPDLNTLATQVRPI
ncbi:hypothetical protein AB0I81_39625 [Nonomuraea sp. NPDC050404]|uniref:hypothetical protein n=1 Tax=Nonomuraea sp. NPDC050404 TaxID=3155783 RepID=UPI0033D7F256